MSKPFFEAFPKLNVRRDLYDLFRETDVVRLATNKTRTKYKVCISSSHLIHHSAVVRMQRELAGQVFGGGDTEVYIREDYHLSAQYTPRILLEEYQDSLGAEFDEYSHLAGRHFRSASFDFPEADHLVMTIPDSCFARDVGDEILSSLIRVFTERCHIPVRAEVCYRELTEKERRGKKGAGKPAGFESAPAAAALSAPKPPTIVGAGEPEGIQRAPEEGAPEGPEIRETNGSRGRPSEVPWGQGKGAGRGRKKADPEERSRSSRASDNPDVLFGREVEEDAVPIADILAENDRVVIRGQVISTERRDIRNERTIVSFALTDFTDSITGKVFIHTEEAESFLQELKPGTCVKVRGVVQMDTFIHELAVSPINGIMKIPAFTTKRSDHYETKRVELHCHTKMSDMDGVSECSDIVKQAYAWGMPAIAITDHGNVQAFPDANHTREALLAKENDRRKEQGLAPVDEKDFFKVIYGVECYLVDDMQPVVSFGTAEGPEDTLAGRPYVVFDLETTGLSSKRDRIIEFGAVRVENGEITGRFSEFVNPGIPIPYNIQQLTTITDAMVEGADPVEKVLPRFLEFAEGAVLVGHNVSFDAGFVKANCGRLGLPYDFTSADTIGMARIELPGHGNYRLETVAKLLDVPLETHHRAVDDAECTAGIFLKLIPLLEADGLSCFGAINEKTKANPDTVRHLNPMYHCILLAKNETGRVNLYTMISESHIKYYNRRPRVPRSLLMQRREGIIVGSACSAGELFQAILEDRSDEQIYQTAEFYDYLEIQPTGNDGYLLTATDRDGGKKYPQIESEEDIRDINRRIVALGEKLGKPVCATCDVHFLNPEDQIYRTILQDSMTKNDAEEPAPLFLRTTDEMMEEFAYLGAKKCEEVVILNTRKIADMVEPISPVRPDKCPPVIPHSDETLREICYSRAHKLYGDPLPSIVEERLEKELSSIIKNGYSVMYIIAQKLVWKSNEDGYLVGSRGSVGSSFVATMSGITEVNPLPPHYYCPECHYSDFDSELVRSYEEKTGIDLPPRMCPVCGAKLKKDGFNIPFETFLGFKGDKEPDIDLNFSGEYQSKAHAYTKVIFGAEQTFKAGTIATVAEKTAFGYVKNYFERLGTDKRKCEIERLKMGLVGVRRSTGQHPGGIVVLPVGEDINTFTPVQHPANDMTTDIITTHFDYHSIDHNLLKLDILGHDDPTMVRMLQDLTGLDPMEIPLDDPEVMSLFQTTEALKVTPDQIGTNVGTLGVPEFGTKFVMGMLEDTKPTTMTELVKISGLSHGTDVWLGNAQTHIEAGDCTLMTCIGCRDDIMVYLIARGMDKSLSFKTMESVRKGKGLKPEMVEAMQEAGVPEWYMDSCRRIKYMFPKGHAAAYVMMALRIAYCKVHYPLAYYCAYFSIRATDFDYEIMAQGKGHLYSVMEDYNRRKDSLTPKEESSMGDMLIVREFYERGFEFVPIELNTVKSRMFQITDGKLMPSLKTINGLGEKAADAVVEAVKDGPFTSRDNFRDRTKVSKNLVDLLDSLGILGSLPESDQISLFDFL